MNHIGQIWLDIIKQHLLNNKSLDDIFKIADEIIVEYKKRFDNIIDFPKENNIKSFKYIPFINKEQINIDIYTPLIHKKTQKVFNFLSATNIMNTSLEEVHITLDCPDGHVAKFTAKEAFDLFTFEDGTPFGYRKYYVDNEILPLVKEEIIDNIYIPFNEECEDCLNFIDIEIYNKKTGKICKIKDIRKIRIVTENFNFKEVYKICLLTNEIISFKEAFENWTFIDKSPFGQIKKDN